MIRSCCSHPSGARLTLRSVAEHKGLRRDDTILVMYIYGIAGVLGDGLRTYVAHLHGSRHQRRYGRAPAAVGAQARSPHYAPTATFKHASCGPKGAAPQTHFDLDKTGRLREGNANGLCAPPRPSAMRPPRRSGPPPGSGRCSALSLVLDRRLRMG